MFDQVFESLKKATETGVQMQQEVFKKWVGMWPGMPTPMAPPAIPLQQMQQKWADTINELTRRQREVMEKAFKKGHENIESAFKLGQIKNPDELRTSTVELWRKCLDSLRETQEAQMHEFQVATEKWLELMTKPAS